MWSSKKPSTGYDDLINYFEIISLNNRFRLLDLKFLFKLLHNHINCPEILGYLL
jgi:hypothetical protein